MSKPHHVNLRWRVSPKTARVESDRLLFLHLHDPDSDQRTKFAIHVPRQHFRDCRLLLPLLQELCIPDRQKVDHRDSSHEVDSSQQNTAPPVHDSQAYSGGFRNTTEPDTLGSWYS